MAAADITERAEDLVAYYRTAAPRHVRARAEAAKLLAKDRRHTPEQAAYWKAVADGCEKILADRAVAKG